MGWCCACQAEPTTNGSAQAGSGAAACNALLTAAGCSGGLAVLVQGCHRLRRAALRHDVARAVFAAPALCRHAKLELDFVKTHPRARMACNLTVGYTAADTDDHGAGGWGRL